MTCTVSRNSKYVDKNELTIENLIRKNIVLTYLSKFDIMKKEKRKNALRFISLWASTNFLYNSHNFMVKKWSKIVEKRCQNVMTAMH